MSRRMVMALLGSLALVAALPVDASAGRRADAFVAVVVADPDAPELGAAGVFCGLRDAASMAAIDPAHGAVVIVPPGPAEATAGLRQLKAGTTADALVSGVPGIEHGVSSAAVTFDAPPAARAGENVPLGAASTGTNAALVVGGFAGHDLGGARTALEGDDSVAERLLAALDAAWVPDACTGRPVDAFLIVTGPAGAPLAPARGLPAARRRVGGGQTQLGGTLAADELADKLLDAAAIPHPKGVEAPEIYLSLLQPPGGFDAVQLLGQAYEQTSATRSPAPSMRSTPDRGEGGDSRLSYVALGLLAIALGGAVVGISRRLRAMKDD